MHLLFYFVAWFYWHPLEHCKVHFSFGLKLIYFSLFFTCFCLYNFLIVESNSGHTKLSHWREGLDVLKHAYGATICGNTYYAGESVICSATCFLFIYNQIQSQYVLFFGLGSAILWFFFFNPGFALIRCSRKPLLEIIVFPYFSKFYF